MSFYSHAMRKGTTPTRIEQALANGPMTIMEIANQLHLALATVRNHILFTDAIPAGRLRIRSGRPRIRYALRGAPIAQSSDTETSEHITVRRVERALLLQPMTIPELCRALALSESSIRVTLPRTKASAIGYRRPRQKLGRSAVVYGLLSD